MWSLTSRPLLSAGARSAKNKILFPIIQQCPETSLMKRIHDLAHSLPKLLSLPQCTRNKTDPDPRPALATPSSPTWGNGPGPSASVGAGRVGLWGGVGSVVSPSSGCSVFADEGFSGFTRSAWCAQSQGIRARVTGRVLQHDPVNVLYKT